MRRAGSAVLLATTLLGASLATGTAGAAPPPGPPGPSAPPQPHAAPPAGGPPGPALGLRAPARCTPPAAGPRGSDVGTRLQLGTVHRLATGRGQLIAVIDTGVASHPRLAGRLRGGGDYLTGGDGLDDCDGHGTAVAGLLAAAADPADDVVGIAPDAGLLSIRQSSPAFTVPGPDGAPRPAGDTATLAEAVVLAVHQGATVVNISEAVCLPPDRAAVAGGSLQAALRYAATADVVVVAAAGNVGVGGCAAAGVHPEQVALPGWYGADLLTVGAVGPDDAAAPFTVPGPWVDVAAPGTGLRSLAVGGGLTGDGVEGTSFAAPWVAGLAALVRERFPDLTAAQVADRIVATARRPATGRDDAVGRGVVDPVAALTAEPAVLLPGPATGRPTAALPGTVLTPPATAPPGGPDRTGVDLVLLAALLAATGAAAGLLRRHPGLSPPQARRPPPGPPPRRPAPGRWGAGAAPPREPARRG